MRYFLVICCCFMAFDLLAQNPASIEADLLKSFKKIDYCRDKEYNDTTGTWVDSLEKSNNVFAKKLQAYVTKYPATITYPFGSLAKENLDISTSADGLFRIYSWDTWTGGTMHFFENVMQYKSGATVKAIIDTPKGDGDNRPNYNKMYTFKMNGKAYYISAFLYIGSSKDVAEGVHIFTIENGKLTDAKLIKTHSGLHSELSYGYDFGSVVNIDYDKRPRTRFDSATNIIYLPLVDGNNQMTNQFIQYKFTGQYFERVKN